MCKLLIVELGTVQEMLINLTLKSLKSVQNQFTPNNVNT